VAAGSISYQWFKDGTAIPNAQAQTYVKSPTTSEDNGVYSVRLISGGSTKFSDAVSVLQGVPDLVLTPAIGATAIAGGSMAFSVQVRNEALLAEKLVPITYSWAKDGVLVSGATLASLPLASLEVGDSGIYAVTVTAGSYGSSTVSAALQVAAINITSQPQSVQVLAGTSVNLSVSAVAGGSLGYQWRKGGVAISAANSSVYTIPSVQIADVSGYDVVVTSGFSSATSQTATVEILSPVVIDTAFFAKQTRALNPGQTLNLQVSASGTPPVSYQWLKNSQVISGATLSSYGIAAVESLDAGTYSVVVSNVVSTEISSGKVQITVNQLPPSGTVAGSINGVPVSSGSLAAVPPNAVVVLSATLPSGTPTTNLTYQWRRNGSPVSGGTAGTLSLGAMTSLEQEGQYDVVLSNTLGSAIWTGAAVNLSERPVIKLSELVSLTVLAGSDLKWASFLAGPSTQTLTYQWKRGSTVVSTGSSNALEIRPVTALNSGSYTVTASNSFSSVTSVSAQLNVLEPVRITVQPVGISVNPGASATFAVTATGGNALYQWLRDGQPIAGATSRTFVMPAVSVSDTNTKLSVRVSNEDPISGKVLSSVTSDPATLTVRTPVVVAGITPSTTQLLDIGQSLTLSVSATGAGPLLYQWRKDGVAILTGGTQASLVVNNVNVASQGSYDVVVKNLVNEVISGAVGLTVKVPVSITQQPVGRTANAGKPVTLVVAASGTAPFTYQWRKDGVAILTGGTQASYVISNLALSDEGSYDVVVNNPAGIAVSSNAAAVFVNNEVNITTQPQSPQPVLLGTSAQAVVFEVVATTTGKPLRYQWRRNAQPIADAISSTYRIGAVTLADRGDYDVLVSSGASTVTSALATLEVYPALTKPTITPVGGYPAVVSGGSVRLQAANVSAGSLSYQWYAGSQAITGAVGSTLDIVPTDVLASYSVQVRVLAGSANLGTATSDPVPVQRLKAVSVLTSPSDTNVNAGESVVFAVTAEGGAPLSYQWERKRSGRWEKVVGAVSSELRFSAVRLSDEGDYRVLVSNARNTLAPEARLEVREAEVITSQPVGQTVNPGDTALFEVKAKGVDLSYQWRLNGVPILGGTGSVLTVPSATVSGKYGVLVTHAFGSSLSETVRLEVRVPASVVTSPVSLALAAGKSAVLLVKAGGSRPLSYQWRKDNVELPGEVRSQLVVTGLGVYDVLVSNAAGKALSEPAIVSIANGVEIQVQPPLTSVARPGETVSFAVVATGTPVTGSSALAYQWYKQNGNTTVRLTNGGRISGANAAQLTIAGVLPQTSASELGSAGTYYVEVKGQANTVNSVGAALTVVSPPVIVKNPLKSVVTAPGVGRFSVSAEGTAPFTYEWLRNGQPISSPTVEDSGAKLVLSGVTAAQNGEIYSVVVRNTAGLTTSGTARLIVLTRNTSSGPVEGAPTEPQRVVLVNKGSSYTFASSGQVASEGTRLVYQWRKEGVEIVGANSSSYTLGPVSRTDAGVYELRTSLLVDVPGGENDGAELSRSLDAGTLLVVNNGPMIETMAAQSARPGQTVVFVPSVKVMDTATQSLVAAPSTGVTYLWKKGNVTLSSGSVSSAGALTLPAVTAADSGTYSLTATYNGVTGEPSPVSLTVAAPFTLSLTSGQGTLMPVLSSGILSGYNLELALRSRLVLEIAATNGGPFTYQWRFNGANIVGATARRFEVSSVQASHAGRYDVVVSGASDRLTSVAVTLSLRDALRITSQPTPKLTVNPGQPITLSVGVNSPAVSYQWIKGVGRTSTSLSGGSSSTLTIPSAQESDEGTYSVIVTSATGQGRVSSAASRVTVNNPVVITQSPVGPVSAVVPGVDVNFSVKATGTGPLSYQWTRNGQVIPGANADTFKISSVAVKDAGIYRAVVRNPVSAEGVESAAATLGVSLPVVVTGEPNDAKFNVGNQPASLLAVTAQGDGVLSYQWRRNGVSIIGGTSALLVPTKALTVYDAGFYDVVIKNTVAGVEVSRAVSRKAMVQVLGNAPADASTVLAETWTANEGDTISLSSYASGANWARAGSSVLDVNRTRGITDVPTLTVRAVTPTDAGVYVASALSNGTLTGASVRWTLNVVPVPVITAEPVDTGVLPGKTALVSAGLTITSDTRLQWYFQSTTTSPWVAVPGATSSTYRVAAAANLDGGYYRLEATNTAGTVSSRSALVTVMQPVAVNVGLYTGGVLSGGSVLSGTLTSAIISGGDLSGAVPTTGVNPGGDVSLVAFASGDLNTAGHSFQWYKLSKSKVWTVMKGAVEDVLSLTGVKETDDTLYRVRAFGLVNNAIDSAPVRLAVNDPVSFVGGQKSKALALVGGDSTTLSVQALGTDVHYQWYKDNAVIGTDAPTLAISNATALSAGTYGVVIYNAFSQAGATASTLAVPSPATAPFEVARVSVQLPATLSGLSIVQGGTVNTGIFARVDEGQTFALRVTIASGTTLPLSYQWRRNGVALTSPGASGRLSTLPSYLELAGITANAASSGVYDVVVSNQWGASVSTPLNVVVDLAPVITSQPQNVFTADGSSATFRVEASGTGLSYQWYSSATADFAVKDTLTTDPILSLVNVGTASSGLYYKVVVTKSPGQFTPVESLAARLTVTTAGDISITGVRFTGLADGVALPESTVVAVGTVNGSGTLRYQWRKDGVALTSTGATGTVVTGGTARVNVSIGNDSGGIYDLVVDNGANFAYSAPVTLAVDPEIESLEAPGTVNPGDGVRFQVKATSKNALSYQWYKGANAVVASANVSGVTSDILAIQSASEADAGTYRVEVRYTSNAAVKTSRSASLNVSALGIVTQPVGFTLEEGGSRTLSVVANSATAYKWFKDGVAVSGGTASTLEVTASAPVNGVYDAAGIYQVEVSNSGAALRSNAVTVQVNPALRVTIDAPTQSTVGESINLVATATGTGPFTYSWRKDGRVVGNESRLLVNPVTVSDAGTYTVSVTTVNALVQASTVLSVRNVPEILVAPASQVVAEGKTARLFVVARFDGPLSYQWYLNGGSLSGATSKQLSVAGGSLSSSGAVYTVRVSSATDATTYTEATARLSKPGATSTTDTDSVLGEITPTQWWVYSVDASGRWTSSTVRDAASDRLGYWVVERVTTNEVETAGRSAWIWPSNTGAVALEWLAADQQVQEVADTSRAEFSVVANRMPAAALETFVLSGRFETGGDAATYGAPDLISGEYDVEAALNVDLSWDSLGSASLQGVTSWATVQQTLRTALDSVTTPAQAPAGD
jgi:hypothetical protein